MQRNLKPLGEIANVVAVASGKGGVGKSTVAVNLALAWAAQGARVGILDADIYGPSQPLMLGLDRAAADLARWQAPQAADEPRRRRAMSIGFLVDARAADGVARPDGDPGAHAAAVGDRSGATLDYLVVDMPPGTGDIQLTLAQRVPVAGAVIVTTPQDIALADARKGLKMFEKVSVPVLGIVENMSIHVCSQLRPRRAHLRHRRRRAHGRAVRRAAARRAAARCAHPRGGRRRAPDGGGRARIRRAPAPTSRWRGARPARSRVRARDRSSLFPKIVVEET